LYVAAAWGDRAWAALLMEYLEQDHEITYDWTSGGPDVGACQAGIGAADALVLAALKPSGTGGTNVELGMALAFEKPVFVLGDMRDDCLFVEHGLVQRVDSLEELTDALDDEGTGR
jgi:hypothetical protein